MKKAKLFKVALICATVLSSNSKLDALLFSEKQTKTLASIASGCASIGMVNLGSSLGSNVPAFYDTVSPLIFSDAANPYNIFIHNFLASTKYGTWLIGLGAGIAGSVVYAPHIYEQVIQSLKPYTVETLYGDLRTRIETFLKESGEKKQTDLSKQEELIEEIDSALAEIENNPTVKKQYIRRFKSLKKCLEAGVMNVDEIVGGIPQSNGAEFFKANEVKTSFKDVAGALEAKEALQDVINFIKNEEKYREIGAKPYHGILLTGNPGNGKTLLARSLAGEAGTAFLSVSGSALSDMYLGESAKNIRSLFDKARSEAPCIIFIDEIDALGATRSTVHGDSAGSEKDATLTQLLTEMDGFATEGSGVVVIAATNRPDMLDPALLRPGRFDRKIAINNPDLETRKAILKIHASKVKMAPDADLDIVAQKTAGFSGAKLANLINGAALEAVRAGRAAVSMLDLESYFDTIMVGAENKTLSRTEEEIYQTAVHESGHTLINIFTPNTNPLHKVTIASRGGTLGVMWHLPNHEITSLSQEEMLAQIMVCLGGRIAEETIFGTEKRSTGASNDFMHATAIAHDMVCEYGMSNLGPITLYNERVSQDMLAKIDAEKNRIIGECYKRAQALMQEHMEDLKLLAQELVKKETLTAQEVYALLNIEPINSLS
jgi:cell division protease FtsH